MPSLSPTDFVRGSLDAPVIIVHYGDFECPFSGALAPVLREIETRFGDKVAVVFRQFPLSDVHPNALGAALAAQAAEDRFWAMHDLLFENQEALREADLLDYARQIGLDTNKFHTVFASQATREAVEDSVQQARSVGIHGTPTLFLNGQFHDNHEGLWKIERLLALVEQALQNA